MYEIAHEQGYEYEIEYEVINNPASVLVHSFSPCQPYILQHMWKLAPVRAAAQPGEYVIAQDVLLQSGKVVKKFFKGDLNTLRALKERMDSGDTTLPPWNRSFHWYEVIDERRPARIFVDIETKHGSYERVRNGVDVFISLLNMALGDEYEWMIADASDASKISFHVIGGPLLTNLYHVGAVIRRLSLYAHNSECPDLFDDTGEFIIDEAIYTRGRQFRLFGACKLGSTRVLQSSHAWWEALVNVDGASQDQLEIDKSMPMSTSMSAMTMFKQVNDKWVRREHTIQGMSIRGIPACLREVIRSLRQHDPEIQVVDCEFSTIYKSWRIPSRSTRCGIAQRVHKSNHVWYTIDVMGRTVFQRCMDECCGGQSVPVAVEGWDERVYEPCHYKGAVSGTCERLQLERHEGIDIVHGKYCVEPYELVEKPMKSKMFRQNMRIWKADHQIIYPCQIYILFRADNVLYRLGTLEAWDDRELRVKDMIQRPPVDFSAVWAGSCDIAEMSFNDVQRDLLRFIYK